MEYRMLEKQQDINDDLDATIMNKNACKTTKFLKSMAHEGRLMILCKLSEAPASVSQLEEFLGLQQSEVSKQLARLRKEKLVKTKRKGRSIIYDISDVRAKILIDTLYDLFCAKKPLE